jgi:hypothetical protein
MTAKPTGGQGPAADGFAQAHSELLADSTIQFELPPIAPPTMPDWLVALLRLLNSPELKPFYWIILGLLAAWILYRLASRLLGWSPVWGRKVDEPGAPDLRPEASAAQRLLEEADALARQGRFSEAVHLLLFRSVEDIDRRRPGLLRPALTSRDIAALPDLPVKPRNAFARIATIVEFGLFASRPILDADWKACRSAYEEFAFADGWRG